jgi:hypothetical protein
MRWRISSLTMSPNTLKKNTKRMDPAMPRQLPQISFIADESRNPPKLFRAGSTEAP